MAETKRGRLGVASLAAATNTAVYEVTAAMDANVSIFLTNPTGSDARVNVAIVDGAVGDIASEDYILYKEGLLVSGEHRIDDIEMDASEAVVVYSDVAGVVVRVDGVEEDSVTALGVRKLTSQTLGFADFTDAAATGTIDFTTGTLPAGAIVLGWKAVVSAGFAGDVSAVVSVGVAGDLDAYSADTAESAFAAGTIGSAALAASAATPIAAVSTPRVTVTVDADYSSVTAGSMVIDIYYLSTSGTLIDTNATADIATITSQSLEIADFTDNTDTTGYIDFNTQNLPAGAIVLGWKAVTSTGFTGDTTATVQVGISGDIDAYSADTAGSCLAAGTVGSMSLANVAATPIGAMSTPRVTVTGTADFTSISAGVMVVTMYYIVT